MTMEFLVPNLHVMLLTQMIEEDILKKRLDDIMELKEDRLLVGFHQGI